VEGDREDAEVAVAPRPGRETRLGFTLIELLVGISVLAILLLIALPSYLDKLVREQVVEALALADVAKPPVQAAWRSGAELPADNAAAGLPVAEQIVNQRVKSVVLEEGAIHIHFGNQAHGQLQGKVLTVRPAGVRQARVVPLVWLCAAAPVPQQMAALGENRTTVPPGMLPLRCR
jgi:type IV pilus assembly protein PilA